MLQSYVDMKAARPFAISAVTGEMAVSVVGATPVFAMRLSPTAPLSHRAFLTRVHLTYEVTVAHVPATQATRGFSLIRGSGAAATAGVACNPMRKDLGFGAPLLLHSAQGGDCRIGDGTVTGLGVVGILPDADPFLASFSLAAVGGLSARAELTKTWDTPQAFPPALRAGELFILLTKGAMDGTGRWILKVDVEGFEAPVL